MKRRRTSGRTARLAILLLFLGSWFTSSAHRLSTPHRVCELHGALEHGFASDPGAHSNESPLTPVYRGQGPAHEECDLGPFTRVEVAPLLLPQEASALVLCPAGIAPPPRCEPLPESALFLLAPSRSPPA